MSEHPFTSERERALEGGINALTELGYFGAARTAQHALDEQRRARIHRGARCAPGCPQETS
jgi:hypothetical protein